MANDNETTTDDLEDVSKLVQLDVLKRFIHSLIQGRVRDVAEKLRLAIAKDKKLYEFLANPTQNPEQFIEYLKQNVLPEFINQLIGDEISEIYANLGSLVGSIESGVLDL